jgi:polar amino acid transport system permease protein
VELTGAVREVENQSFRTFEAYLLATILYLTCSLLIMAVGAQLSRRANLAGTR